MARRRGPHLRRAGLPLAAAAFAACCTSLSACSASPGPSVGSGSGSAKASASPQYCAQARVVANESSALASDPGRIKSDFESLYRLQALAPQVVKPDLASLSAFYRKIASLLPAEPTRAQIAQAVQSASEERRFAGVGSSATTVTTFTQRACGVDLSPSAG
jgi:hypothetical protein